MAQQANYLRNPLPAGPRVCQVCRGPAGDTYAQCYQCYQHRVASAGRLANVVVPIAYGIKGEQHYQNLVTYKSRNPSAVAQTRLRDLALLFLNGHWRCLTATVNGPLTHLAIVPSTSGRAGTHPLISLLAPRIPLPQVTTTANPAYEVGDRDFHRDRFHVPTPSDLHGAGHRVLVLDDTWTSGGRAQSLAYAMKAAGATSVVTVVLGRLIKHEYQPSQEILRRVERIPFDIQRCCLPTCATTSA